MLYNSRSLAEPSRLTCIPQTHDSLVHISIILVTFRVKVARYNPQGYFKLHTDHVEAFNGLVCGGRLGTLIIYLNEDFSGGQTNFPYVGATVEPRTGDAIYFHSVRVRSVSYFSSPFFLFLLFYFSRTPCRCAAPVLAALPELL